MSAVPESPNFSHSDLTDSIAEALPPNLRAAYYRELIHCRSLPENDEMLRVIRILQILTYLIQQAPAAVVAERDKIEALFSSLTDALQRTTQSIGEYQRLLSVSSGVFVSPRSWKERSYRIGREAQ